MPSPFPGMDPYLEDPVFWAGFHARLYNAISTALNRRLPAGYFAEIDEYVWLQGDEPDDRRVLGKPDTFVTDRTAPPPAAGGVAVLTPPVLVTLPKAKKKTHRYVKIVGPDHALVVTVIEVLSPSNKEKSEDRVKYLAKRGEYLGTGTNLVEIDLLRDGDRMPLGKPSPPQADYYAFVCRGRNYPRAGVWPFTVRDAIPVIPVPLKPDCPDTPLDLQACVTDIYDANRYAMRVDYTQPVTPAFRKPDAEWVADLLERHAGNRPA